VFLKALKKFNFAITLSVAIIMVFALAFINSEISNFAQNAQTEKRFSVGTNLNELNGYSPQLPLIDHFKLNYGWQTSSFTNSAFDTKEIDKLELDADGWPTTLGGLKSYNTLLLREIRDTYKPGRYIVLYDGKGTIQYGFDSSKINSESVPNRDVINLANGNGGVYIQVTSTDPDNTGDYIRNIRIIREDQLSLYEAGQVFNPDWLNSISHYRLLRFMDWMRTNNSKNGDWSDRAKLSDYRYSSEKGAPLELMVRLANEMKIDPWFNMPHLATDEYMTKFAEYIKENLDPNLLAHIEFSNEVWNFQFQQSQYALARGQELFGNVGDGYIQWYGSQVSRMCDIWKDSEVGVFKDERHRINCISSGQTGGNKNMVRSVILCTRWVALGNRQCGTNVDTIAITGYFSARLQQTAYTDIVRGWIEDWKNGGTTGLTMAIEQALDGRHFGRNIPNANEWVDDSDSVESLGEKYAHFSALASSLGKKLNMYEGGQHITVNGSSYANDTDYNNFFAAINRDPRMYDLYERNLQLWREDPTNTRELFTHFSDIGRYTRFGYWGALENLNSLPEGTPKYNALKDFSEGTDCWWENCAIRLTNEDTTSGTTGETTGETTSTSGTTGETTSTSGTSTSGTTGETTSTSGTTGNTTGGTTSTSGTSTSGTTGETTSTSVTTGNTTGGTTSTSGTSTSGTTGETTSTSGTTGNTTGGTTSTSGTSTSGTTGGNQIDQSSGAINPSTTTVSPNQVLELTFSNLRRLDGQVIINTPATLVIRRPDGIEYDFVTNINTQGIANFVVDLRDPVIKDFFNQTGTYSVTALVTFSGTTYVSPQANLILNSQSLVRTGGSTIIVGVTFLVLLLSISLFVYLDKPKDLAIKDSN
jgi:hypothetical protein